MFSFTGPLNGEIFLIKTKLFWQRNLWKDIKLMGWGYYPNILMIITKKLPFQLMPLTQMPWLKLSYLLSLIITLVFKYRWTVVVTRKFYPLITQILFFLVPADNNRKPLRVPFIWLYQLVLLACWLYETINLVVRAKKKIILTMEDSYSGFDIAFWFVCC